ncbi:hypothetical protein pb186bvf_003825 [Paramecium bursaria]
MNKQRLVYIVQKQIGRIQKSNIHFLRNIYYQTYLLDCQVTIQYANLYNLLSFNKEINRLFNTLQPRLNLKFKFHYTVTSVSAYLPLGLSDQNFFKYVAQDICSEKNEFDYSLSNSRIDRYIALIIIQNLINQGIDNFNLFPQININYQKD